MKQIVVFLMLFASVLLTAGCSTKVDSIDESERSVSPDGWPQFDAHSAVMSNTGDYAVMYELVGGNEIPTNQRFSLKVYPFRKSDMSYAPAGDVQVKADAAMPHHGHGMNVVPTAQRQPDGSVRVDGMLFHMPGRWELYFDITRNGITERAQTEVFLE